MMFQIGINRSMKWAWLFLTLYLLAQNTLRFIRPTEPIEMKMALFLSAIACPLILIYAIGLAKTKIGDATQSIFNRAELTAWGWFWRSFVLLFAQGLILLLFSKIASLDLDLRKLNALELILWLAPFSVTSTIGAWILYSKDRPNQLRLVLATISGH